MIKAILFDLDGTLLPMDLGVFIKEYISTLAAYLAPCGYNPDTFVKGMWAAIGAMMENDGEKTNEQLFYEVFASVPGKDARCDKDTFDRYYDEQFPKVRAVCGYDPRAKELIDELRALPVTVALATSPVYPEAATLERMRWAGLDKSDFALVTTYEDARHTKPSTEYYRDVAKSLGVLPEECLMIGNDTRDDLPAKEVGMKVFLLTDNLLNRDGIDFSDIPSGGYDQMREFIYSALN